jgi:transposase-like protein
MRVSCAYCAFKSEASKGESEIVRTGFFLRISDQVRVQRFFCKRCQRGFSLATEDSCFKQHKREFNKPLASLLVSGVSLRRAALILKINRKTVARKLVFLGRTAHQHLFSSNLKRPKCKIIEFDDLETFEHTKLKPLSVTLAVEFKTRRILGFKVSQMPAKGHLAKKSFKKYGPRKDFRSFGQKALLKDLLFMTQDNVIIKSDQNPHYKPLIKKFFPHCEHEAHKGQRGCVTGQGELKKIGFDPLFSLNHTCAMFRANINRLFRKTWCTTKRPDRLFYHIALYSVFHNGRLVGA